VPAQGRNGSYYTVSGTSPACALVAGVAALIKSKYPGISPAEVMEALTTTAQQPMAGGNYNVLTGFGIVDADAALIEAGKLVQERPAGTRVALSAHFGGGAAAAPAAPVGPRGPGQLVVFVLLALVSLAAAGGGLAVLRRRSGHG
jgi:subtilisin family serine protease